MQSVLGMNAKNLFHLNLGNDRHNIDPLVWPMQGGTSNLAALDFVVRGGICRYGQSSTSMANVLQCGRVTTSEMLPPSQIRLVGVLRATEVVGIACTLCPNAR